MLPQVSMLKIKCIHNSYLKQSRSTTALRRGDVLSQCYAHAIQKAKRKLSACVQRRCCRYPENSFLTLFRLSFSQSVGRLGGPVVSAHFERK